MKRDIKLIAIDLDGTLINKDKVLTPYTKEALLCAIEKGAKIVPTTGRAVSGLPDYLKDIPLEYGIFCNGASVYNLKDDKELYSDRMTIEDSLDLLHKCANFETIISHAADGSMYSELNDKPRLSNFNLRESTQDILLTTRIFVESIEEQIKLSKTGIDKFVLFFKDQDTKAKAKEYFESFGTYHVVSSLYENLEIGKESCNKGRALEFLTNHLELDTNQVMALGDANNDCEMIQYAGTGVAMGNADESIKEIANYITTTNNEDGVAKAIYKFMA